MSKTKNRIKSLERRVRELDCAFDGGHKMILSLTRLVGEWKFICLYCRHRHYYLSKNLPPKLRKQVEQLELLSPGSNENPLDTSVKPEHYAHNPEQAEVYEPVPKETEST